MLASIVRKVISAFNAWTRGVVLWTNVDGVWRILRLIIDVKTLKTVYLFAIAIRHKCVKAVEVGILVNSVL